MSIRTCSYLTSKAIVKNEHGGKGSFAIAPILKGEIVAAFGGWVLSLEELNKIGGFAVSRSIQIDDDLYLTPLEAAGNGDMINHSCSPTCGLLGSQLLVAMVDLKPGDPLTYDYCTSDSSDYDEFDCGCGSAECRKRVTGNDWKIESLQKKYDGWFSSYLQRKIKGSL